MVGHDCGRHSGSLADRLAERCRRRVTTDGAVDRRGRGGTRVADRARGGAVEPVLRRAARGHGDDGLARARARGPAGARGRGPAERPAAALAPGRGRVEGGTGTGRGGGPPGGRRAGGPDGRDDPPDRPAPAGAGGSAGTGGGPAGFGRDGGGGPRLAELIRATLARPT